MSDPTDPILVMPIQIRCQCGKALKIPDSAAGKAVKCPGCGKTMKVPAAGGAGRSPAAAAAKPSAAPSSPAPSFAPDVGRMDDLFEEEGFTETVEAVCPACRAPMPASAILCTKCGYNKETGTRLDAHKTAGVDIDHGTLALQKAAEDMVKDKAMQDKLLSGGGMPWWALALVLFMLGSGLTIAVLVVNASRRVDEAAPPNPMALFLALSGAGFYLVSLGAFIMIVVHAFKQSIGRGLMTLLIPLYALYHVAKNWQETWKYLAASIVLGGIAGGLFAAAAAQVGG